METQLVTFELANEHYGVNITAVESTIKLQPITFVPRAPQYVKGVINLRGVVLPVVCLRQRFGLPQSEYTKDTRIIVIEIDGKKVGIVVDAVTEVLSVQNEAIEPPSPLVTSQESAFITGIAKFSDRLVILLDFDKVLTDQNQVNLQAVPAA